MSLPSKKPSDRQWSLTDGRATDLLVYIIYARALKIAAYTMYHWLLSSYAGNYFLCKIKAAIKLIGQFK